MFGMAWKDVFTTNNMWRTGTILRNLITKKPFIVFRSNKVGTTVVDLESKIDPAPAQVILERNYDSWIDEKLLSTRINKLDQIIWEKAVVI